MEKEKFEAELAYRTGISKAEIRFIFKNLKKMIEDKFIVESKDEFVIPDIVRFYKINRFKSKKTKPDPLNPGEMIPKNSPKHSTHKCLSCKSLIKRIKIDDNCTSDREDERNEH